MTTRETILSYLGALQGETQWADFLADTMTFTSFAFPIRQVAGKEAYLEATKRFFSLVTGVEIREVMTEGQKACVLSRYSLKPPAGAEFSSDVAEIFTVSDDKITSLQIYFDTAPFPT